MQLVFKPGTHLSPSPFLLLFFLLYIINPDLEMVHLYLFFQSLRLSRWGQRVNLPNRAPLHFVFQLPVTGCGECPV